MYKAVIFPYGLNLKEGGNLDMFPAAEISFLTREREWLSFFLVIDSGASVSALPKSDGETLGIDVETGRPFFVGGIDRKPIKAWRHNIKARLGQIDIMLPVAFLNSSSAPRILGREGIFENFTIIFEESAKRSGFLGIKSKEYLAVARVLNGIE